MSTNFDENTINQLIDDIKNNPKLREKLLKIVQETDYIRRDEFNQLLEEIKNIRLDFNKRFDASDKRFDASDKRFDASERRFEEQKIEFNKRFDASEKRFEEHRLEFRKSVEITEKRFEAMNKKMDYNFNKVYNRLDDMTIALGHDFEEFNSQWLQDFLRVKGYPLLKIKKKTFHDQNYEVFPDSKDVEIDVFNEKPLILGEITAITKTIDKVTIFIRKINFLKKLFGEPKELFFITYGFRPEIREDAMALLEQANVKIYTLRQKDIHELRT